MSLLLSLLGAAALNAETGTGLPSSSVPRISGWLRGKQLGELSGLAPSRRRADRYWAINDSGSPAELFALAMDGTIQGVVAVDNAPNRDWEDLASFRQGGKSWLLVADSGDNLAQFPNHTLYVFAEPKQARGQASPSWTVRYRYAEGRLDSESVAVDPVAGMVYLVSKRVRPSVLYRVPLRPGTDAVQLAERLGPLGGIVEPDPQQVRHGINFLRYAAEPTALDLSCDGRTLAVLTYSRLYFYRRSATGAWTSALQQPADAITLPPLPQAEALSYDRHCTRLYVGSEQPPVPLLMYSITP